VTRTDEDHIATAIYWARQHTDLGVPSHLDPVEARVVERKILNRLPHAYGMDEWTATEWTVILNQHWAVYLDEIGVPKRPPKRIR
jgi:hypothetical protein